MNEPEIKYCLNCKYFIAHYAWNGNRFMSTTYGHCINNYITKKDKLKVPFKNDCSEWKFNQLNKKKNYEKIKDILEEMLERINDFINYFEANS